MLIFFLKAAKENPFSLALPTDLSCSKQPRSNGEYIKGAGLGTPPAMDGKLHP